MKSFYFATFIILYLLTNVFAETLYTNQAGSLYIVNQTTGSGLTTVGSCSCNFFDERLAARPGVSGYLYGVVNSNTTGARLSKVNTAGGAQSLFPLFSEPTLGFAKPFADGIAISPLQPNVAVVTGFDAGFQIGSPTAGQFYVWTVDLDTGSVLSAGVPNPSHAGSITYSLDGTTLFGADSSGRLVTLDPTSGASNLIGDPGLSDFIEGLAFRPSDGLLFAIDGGTNDNTVILNPANGSLVSTLGSIHLGGAQGLAFTIPEPSAILLVASGALVVPFIRRRKSAPHNRV